MSMMWTSHILMSLLTFACGVAVSAGTFAFILVIGVVPRMIKKMNLADRVISIENAIVLGVLSSSGRRVFLLHGLRTWCLLHTEWLQEYLSAVLPLHWRKF